MAFDTSFFLFIFFPLTFISFLIFRLVFKSRSFRNSFLLVASIVFYAWGDIRYVILLIVLTITNYIFARFIDSKRWRKLGWLKLIVILVINVGLLIYFKYTSFFLISFNEIFKTSVNTNYPILPVGISFFTLQSISYLIDVYKKKIKAEKSFINYALYICFFPQLIIGPIIRYKEIIGKIRRRSFNLDNIQAGIKRFIIGLAKKVIVSSTIGIVVDNIYAQDIKYLSSSVLWFTAIGYTLQLYFDFSGYSDMAIGMGKIFGFTIPENFNYPYISKTFTEFWRRWHITLSNWLKDYIYIPLGGNRVSKFRNVVNILIVFTISGFWHGAGLNFIIWGLYHGVFISIEKVFEGWFFGKKLTWLKHMYLFGFVTVGWVIFRADSTKQIIRQLGIMFGIIKPKGLTYNITDFLDYNKILIIVLSIIGSTTFTAKFKSWIEKILEKRGLGILWLVDISYLVLMIIVIMHFASNTYKPFIYTQF